MSFINNYVSVIKDNYVNFNGRARRAEYWQFTLINFLIIMALYIPIIIALIDIDPMNPEIPGYASVLSSIVGIYALATFLPSLAVVVRRLHDTGKSGWFYLIAIIPLVGPIILLVALVKEGTKGANEYGQDPKGENIDIDTFGQEEVFEAV